MRHAGVRQGRLPHVDAQLPNVHAGRRAQHVINCNRAEVARRRIRGTPPAANGEDGGPPPPPSTRPAGANPSAAICGMQGCGRIAPHLSTYCCPTCLVTGGTQHELSCSRAVVARRRNRGTPPPTPPPRRRKTDGPRPSPSMNSTATSRKESSHTHTGAMRSRGGGVERPICGGAHRTADAAGGPAPLQLIAPRPPPPPRPGFAPATLGEQIDARRQAERKRKGSRANPLSWSPCAGLAAELPGYRGPRAPGYRTQPPSHGLATGPARWPR